MNISRIVGRVGVALFIASVGQASAAELRVRAADDGAVEVSRTCDVLVSGQASGAANGQLRYRWRKGTTELSPWAAVRADRSTPLDLCGLRPGRHVLTVEVTDGRKVASDTVTATVIAGPAQLAQGR